MIRSTHIDHIVPDFLMKSESLFLIVLDVEGSILKANPLFVNTCGSLAAGDKFISTLGDNSKSDFEGCLEKLILSPKENQRCTLHLTVPKFISNPYLWEFSVVTDDHMDFMALVGIGISPMILSTGAEQNSLIELFGFGHLSLNLQLQLVSISQAASEKLDLPSEKSLGKNIQELVPQYNWSEVLEAATKNAGLAKYILKSKDSNLQVVVLLERGVVQLFVGDPIARNTPSGKKPYFTTAQLAAIPGPVWLLDSAGHILQQNFLGKKFSVERTGLEFEDGDPLIFPGQRFEQRFKEFLAGFESDFILESTLEGNPDKSWSICFGRLLDTETGESMILVQAVDLELTTALKRLKEENKQLKEIAMKPSYILRSPLSSMLGLLDLIDEGQLDQENRKYFSYLKPLASELDQMIRSNAKKMNQLD
ncbi:hypothetical protein [Algoriphagus namhaensis]